MCQQDLKKYDSIRIAGIVRESIVDGPGLRFAVFCQGCPHGCPGCHNQETHDFNGGYDCDISKIVDAVDKDPLLDGVTFSGGEPFCQPEPLAALGRMVRATGGHVMTYTGYVYEDLLEMAKTDPAIGNLLSVTNVLVDGPYVEELRDLTLEFRGSSNQRLITLDQPADAPL